MWLWVGQRITSWLLCPTMGGFSSERIGYPFAERRLKHFSGAIAKYLLAIYRLVSSDNVVSFLPSYICAIYVQGLVTEFK
jgi:hypothetical protein